MSITSSGSNIVINAYNPSQHNPPSHKNLKEGPTLLIKS